MDSPDPQDQESVRMRAYERALARRLPEGFLSPSEAVRSSGLGVRGFVVAVSAGRLGVTRFDDGAIGFLRTDIARMRTPEGGADEPAP